MNYLGIETDYDYSVQLCMGYCKDSVCVEVHEKEMGEWTDTAFHCCI